VGQKSNKSEQIQQNKLKDLKDLDDFSPKATEWGQATNLAERRRGR